MTGRFVVDNSVVMAWCFEDETDDFTDGVLNAMRTHVALVPSIWPLEVINVLLVAERRKRLSERDGLNFLSLLKKLPFKLVNAEVGDVFSAPFDIARRHGLSSYDASYLELAMREGVPLASKDKALCSAAAAAGVPRFGI